MSTLEVFNVPPSPGYQRCYNNSIPKPLTQPYNCGLQTETMGSTMITVPQSRYLEGDEGTNKGEK